MGLFIVLKDEHQIPSFSGFGFLSYKILSFGRGVAFKESEKFVADRVIIIVFFEEDFEPIFDHFFDSFFVNADNVHKRLHTFFT